MSTPTPITHRLHLPVAVGLSVALTATACLGARTTGQTLNGREPRAPAEREFVNGAIAATNLFGVELYKAAAVTPGNLVQAPLAVMRVLAMARAGAGGTSRQQFDATLHSSMTPDLDGGLNAAALGVAGRTGEKQSRTRKGRVELQQATALWGQRGTHVKGDLLDNLSAHYGEGFHVVDFHVDTDGSRDAVNDWADEATDGLVTEAVPRGGVTPYTRFMAVSATGLRAPWLAPFDADKTRPDRFAREGEPPVDARMMEVTSDQVRRATGQGWEAVELAYLGDELALDVVMADGRPLAALEADLTPDLLGSVYAALDGAPATPIDLRVPRVEFTTSSDLREPLSHLGLTAPFDRTADFSGVTSDELLTLANAAYEGVFGITEDGTNPRPDTASVQGGTPSLLRTSRVVVDRPFLFVVRERATGLALLIGRVVNPS